MNEVPVKREEGIEIDIRDLLVAYLRHWVLILVCGALFVGAAFGYTRFFVTPMYRASVTIYVNNTINIEEQEYVSNANLATSQRLVSTYTTLIESNRVLNKVVEQSGLPYSAGQIRSMMSAEQVGSTEVFKVSISNADPKKAAEIANAVYEYAPAEIMKIVAGSSVEKVDAANVPSAPYTPNYARNCLLGGIIGVVLVIIYVTMKYLLDVRINDSQDIEQMFEYPILGQIPSFDQDAIKKKGYGKYGYGKAYGQTPTRSAAPAAAGPNPAAAGGNPAAGANSAAGVHFVNGQN